MESEATDDQIADPVGMGLIQQPQNNVGMTWPWWKRTTNHRDYRAYAKNEEEREKEKKKKSELEGGGVEKATKPTKMGILGEGLSCDAIQLSDPNPS